QPNRLPKLPGAPLTPGAPDAFYGQALPQVGPVPLWFDVKIKNSSKPKSVHPTVLSDVPYSSTYGEGAAGAVVSANTGPATTASSITVRTTATILVMFVASFPFSCLAGYAYYFKHFRKIRRRYICQSPRRHLRRLHRFRPRLHRPRFLYSLLQRLRYFLDPHSPPRLPH